MLAAVADYSLALAAVPTSIAAIVVGYFTFKGSRNAVPVIKEAAKVEPRLTELEDRQAGWVAALAAKDELIATLRAELADCRGHRPNGAPAAE